MAEGCYVQLETGIMEQLSAAGQTLIPHVSHTSTEKILGVGSKQPLRYFYCS